MYSFLKNLAVLLFLAGEEIEEKAKEFKKDREARYAEFEEKIKNKKEDVKDRFEEEMSKFLDKYGFAAKTEIETLNKKIDESFALLDTGEYGYCESCGIEIGVRRLEARPTATQCIDCKTLDEIREKQRG